MMVYVHYCSKLGEILENNYENINRACPLPDFSQTEFDIYLRLEERYSSQKENALDGKFGFKEYSDGAISFAKPEIKGLIWYGALKLNGEAGEVADKIGKIFRDHDDTVTPELAKAVMYELGDVLWYINHLALAMKFSLEDVAQMNLEKLRGRKDRDTIQGDGDNR